jgi:UDP-GlcNAc:undecaprenyl-phosphate GlcNAc-1-phosphate transferase
MMILLFVFGASLVICTALTPLVRRLAIQLDLVDHPDGHRKAHAKPTPVAGGVAILIASCAAAAGFLVLPNELRDQVKAEESRQLVGLLLAALVICITGVADDFGRLRGRHKLAGQLVAVAVLIGFGLVVKNIRFFNYDIELGLLAIPFTIFFLLGAINSLNLLDGMDGLLSSIGLIITLAMAGMAAHGEHWQAAALAVALAGALFGFLFYNFPPASIFLGDSGSMLIGLVVGVLAIQSSLKGPATVALAAPLAALAIPILDTTAAIVRRKLTGRSLYSTDRGHLHHSFLNRGLSIRGALLAISFFCSLTVVGALASLAFNNELIAVITAITVVGILVGVKLFGHAELMLARRRLAATISSFLTSPSNGAARAMEIRLQGSADWKQLWDPFIASALELNLKNLSLNVNAPAIHESYHARWDCPIDDDESHNLWVAEIPLMVCGLRLGKLQITGHRDEQPVWEKIAELTSLLQKVEHHVTMLQADAGDLLPRADGNGSLSQPHANGKPKPVDEPSNGDSQNGHSSVRKRLSLIPWRLRMRK